jgi:hypothetical protein
MATRAGGRVWHEEALPPPPPPQQQRGRGSDALVILPPEAATDDCTLVREARERGVPCVTSEYIIEQLTQRLPRGVADFLIP